MKKGLIVEHHRRYTVVLAKNGVFYKAKPMHNKQIGEDVLFEEISLKKRGFRLPKIAMVPVVALFILLISPLYLWLANDKVYAVISIDINPSINVKVDRNYHVVDVKANNEDGRRVLEALDIKGESLEDITNRILLYAKDTFAMEEDASVLVAVSYMEDDIDGNTVVEVMNQQIEEIGFAGTVYQAAEEWRIKAEEQEVSMNVIAHETLGEFSDTTKEDDKIIGEANQALISQFFNNKQSSPDDEKVNDEVLELELDQDHTSPNTPDEKEQATEEIETNHPKLPAQASDQAKERLSNNPAAIKGKPYEKGRNNKSTHPSENAKKKGSIHRTEPHPAKENPSKSNELKGIEAPDETVQHEEEPEEKYNHDEVNGLDE